MNRYSVIRGNFPREFLLLQGKGCKWRRCTFCDYHTDTSDNPYATNAPILDMITGEMGVLDIINSGSGIELDEQTLEHIARVVRKKQIHTLWFEAHYIFRSRLAEFARSFAPAEVKFRCGVETFDTDMRLLWCKGISVDVTVADIAKYFKGVCLLCCVEGQTKEQILRDIAYAQRHFEYFSVNIFCNNTTPVKRDDALVKWFNAEVYPFIKDDPRIEILIDNTDLGVG